MQKKEYLYENEKDKEYKTMESNVRKELMQLSETKYRDFNMSLIPGCDNALGVRIPKLRKMASEYVKKESFDNIINYLHNSQEIYFEETMFKGFLIGNLKCSYEVILSEIESFVPHITNWSLCDSFCISLKFTKKHKEDVWSFLNKYINSDKTYEIRFAVVMYLVYFMEEKYLDEIFDSFIRIKNDDYYVKMAVAWAVSVCFVKYEKKTMQFLTENRLDTETHNKAIQKITESLRVDKETKNIVRKLKILT